MKIVSISEEKRKYDRKEEIKEILDEIEESRNVLTGVDLSENSFSPECLLALVQLLSTIPQLETVTFKGIFTQRVKAEVEESLGYVVEYLSKLSGIKYFDLSDNALSLHGMKILCPLVEKMHTLQHLVLNNNGIGRDGGEYLAEALTALSKESVALQSIEIGRNRLEDSARKIGKALELFPYLDSVKIYQNSIPSVIIGDLLHSLMPLHLRVLDIADNFLLEHGSVVLAKCLARWNIEALNASDCLMGDRGLEALAQGIQFRSRVQGELLPEREIDLSYNEITSSSLRSLQEFMQKTAMCTLILTGNEYTSEEVEHLKVIAEQIGSDLLIKEESEDEFDFSSEEESLKEKEKDFSDEIGILGQKLAEMSLHPDEPATTSTKQP
ncbi:Ran GTPase-activating protein 1 [Nematocida homosporus]|uniref:Ran GTPase-activating protein 1 n=1 Tax=Nematocida homosporus TaxID=1912981 RepID=UPI0022210A92|nr:Ran GTPase-activating protein 1 [Nematocida homosporus]KAI5185250.1 Ran GTPase-activating protein 1 [Nematocida homosporus]